MPSGVLHQVLTDVLTELARSDEPALAAERVIALRDALSDLMGDREWEMAAAALDSTEDLAKVEDAIREALAEQASREKLDASAFLVDFAYRPAPDGRRASGFSSGR